MIDIKTTKLKKLQLELEEIKSSRQYKLCRKIFAPYNIIKKYFNTFFDSRVKIAKKKYQTAQFTTDKEFCSKSLKYKKAVILGNAKNLELLSNTKFEEYKLDNNTLTIGLNRSFYKFNTDILLWADYEIIDEINHYNTNNLENTLVVQTTNNDTKQNLTFWQKNKSFENYPYKGLFKARNILISALHLCYIYNIKEIELYGFEFDSRDYFFDTNKYEGIEEYEIKPSLIIENEYLGYDTKKIAREVLEYMINENFKITYNGKSKFLSSIEGLIKNEY
jgi:hypothetical protein